MRNRNQQAIVSNFISHFRVCLSSVHALQLPSYTITILQIYLAHSKSAEIGDRSPEANYTLAWAACLPIL